MAKIYQRLFATFYDPFMNGFERSLFKTRRELLKDIHGKIVEVGAGTGVNFKFYRKGMDVLAVEPSKPMLEKAKKKIPQGMDIRLLNYGACDPELDKIIEPGTVDFVISMLVLCTIPDPKKALIQYRKWLKPEGRLIILEHIHASLPHNRKIQNIINPVWRAFADGCNLNRRTDQLLPEAGFKAVDAEYIKRSLRFIKGIYRK